MTDLSGNTGQLPFSKEKFTRSHRKKADHKAYAGPEDDLQRQCEELLKIRKVKYIHITNRMLKAMRKRELDIFLGFPDIAIFIPGKGYARTYFIELKKKTGKLSSGQKRFARSFNEDYWEVRNVEDFAELLNEFIMPQVGEKDA